MTPGVDPSLGRSPAAAAAGGEWARSCINRIARLEQTILGQSTDHLRRVRASIEDLSREQLGLRFSKWSIQPISRGVNFVGYRIWPTHKLLRRDSVIRARRKIRAYRAGGDHRRLAQFLAAWIGHARWADSRNLMRSLGLLASLEGASHG